MRTSKIKLITPFLLVGIASGLDVSLEKATCDASLPVTADIYMKCANGARCSFGDSVNVYGTCKFMTRSMDCSNAIHFDHLGLY